MVAQKGGIMCAHERAHPDLDEFKDNTVWQEQFNLRHHLCNYYIHDGDVIVDIPCGVGWGTSLLHGGRIYGFDRDIESVDYASLRYGNDKVTFHVADMASEAWGSPWIESESIDVVVCLEGIEHLTEYDADTFLYRAYDILKPLGVICVSTPLNPGVPIRNEFHIVEYNSQSLFDKIEGCGFTVLDMAEKTGGWGCFIFMVGRK